MRDLGDCPHRRIALGTFDPPDVRHVQVSQLGKSLLGESAFLTEAADVCCEGGERIFHPPDPVEDGPCGLGRISPILPVVILAAITAKLVGKFVLVLFLLAIWVMIATAVANYADRKGQSWGFFFAFGLIAWPAALLIAVLLAPVTSPLNQLANDISGNRVDRLKTLAELREQGALSQSEFDAEKAKLLG
jgi:hypothetical protein